MKTIFEMTDASKDVLIAAKNKRVRGISLAYYTQEKITLMANNINSTVRDSLNGRNPFELARLLLDKELLDTLNLKAVEADKIILMLLLQRHT